MYENSFHSMNKLKAHQKRTTQEKPNVTGLSETATVNPTRLFSRIARLWKSSIHRSCPAPCCMRRTTRENYGTVQLDTVLEISDNDSSQPPDPFMLRSSSKVKPWLPH